MLFRSLPYCNTCRWDTHCGAYYGVIYEFLCEAPETWLAEGLTLRFRAGGERFLPLGRRHRQPLKRWLQEAGILPWMRGRIPLLYRGTELVAIADLWLAEETRSVEAAEPRWRVHWTGHPPIR